jgi:hypothetical protein
MPHWVWISSPVYVVAPLEVAGAAAESEEPDEESEEPDELPALAVLRTEVAACVDPLFVDVW